VQKFVRKLTIPNGRRQRFDTFTAVVGLLLWLLSGTGTAGAPQWQSNADIMAAAELHLRKLTGSSTNRTTVRASSLDPRHRLPLCDQAMETFMRRGTEIRATTIVGVRCTGSKPWKVYVPVEVIVTTKVYITSKTLPRDHLLTEADIALDERDVSRLVAGYATRKEELLGQRLKQQLLAGRIITPAMLQADRIVTRGQTVTLIAKSGTVNISMKGKALMDGALDQRIRVENINSGRIIEGVVRSREYIEVLLPAGQVFF